MAQCEPLNSCQVSFTTLDASKNVKFRLSWNSTKFNVVARFRKMLSTVKSISSYQIYKIFGFLTEIIVLPFLIKFDFLRFYSIKPGSQVYDSFLEEFLESHGNIIDGEHCFSSIDKRPVGEDHTGFGGHIAGMCPRS